MKKSNEDFNRSMTSGQFFPPDSPSLRSASQPSAPIQPSVPILQQPGVQTASGVQQECPLNQPGNPMNQIQAQQYVFPFSDNQPQFILNQYPEKVDDPPPPYSCIYREQQQQPLVSPQIRPGQSQQIQQEDTEARALKNMHIIVPEAVKRGSNVTLVCDYDLESAALYSIKWYKNDEEFYRFVPKEAPPDQVFEVAYIDVDISKSNSSGVTLVSVERDTSGEFKCEVSADAPLFHTEIQVAKLIVVEIPEDAPVLKVEVHKIAPGSYLRANCTTPGSYPAMNVTWTLNDEIMHSSRYHNDVNFEDVYDASNIGVDVQIEKSIFRFDALPGLETTQSTFSVKTRPDLFHKGKLRLRCLATMFTLYEAFREEEIQEDAPKLALVMVHKDQRNRGNSIISSVCGNTTTTLLLVLSWFVCILLRIIRKI